MSKSRDDAMAAVQKASEELNTALSQLRGLSADHDQKISYSVHALNNYLMVVSTSVRLLEKRMAGEDREVRKLLSNLRDTNTAMMGTVRGVLTANLPTTPSLIFAEVSFAEIVDAACQTYLANARSKKITLGWSRHRRDTKVDIVLTDRVAAAAVLDNLISNAVKFTPPGEAISVTIARNGDVLTCNVMDRGPGLTAEEMTGLYQRGVALGPRPTGGEMSSGFGLSIAKDLSIALGGSLNCQSVVGQGTSFSFSLPAKPLS